MAVGSSYVIGLICARGGSKRVPRKNLRLLAGKPLVAWAIEVAQACPSLNRVIVSTEDGEIAAVARDYGAEVPFVRPAELARDDCPEWCVWQHAIRTLESLNGRRPDVIVSVSPSTPFRAVEDVEACLAALFREDADGSIGVSVARLNPYVDIVTLDGPWATLFAQSSAPVHDRKHALKVFTITAVAYVVRCDFVLRANYLFDGKVCATLVPEERGFDIDTQLDLAFAEFLLERKRGNQQAV